APGPLEELCVPGAEVVQVPGPGHDLGGVGRPFEGAVMEGDVVLDAAAADEVADLGAEGVRGDEEAVAERAEAGGAEALAEAVALAAAGLGEGVGDEEPAAVPDGAVVVDATGPLLDELVPARSEAVARGGAVPASGEPALARHAGEGRAEGAAADP